MEVPKHQLRPYHYTGSGEMNLRPIDYYAPNFTDPLYFQYVRKPCKELEVKATPLILPELIRRHRGWTFQKLFPSDPCPQGWTSFENMLPEQQAAVKQFEESDPRGFCFLSEHEFEPIMYTDKFQFYGATNVVM